MATKTTARKATSTKRTTKAPKATKAAKAATPRRKTAPKAAPNAKVAALPKTVAPAAALPETDAETAGQANGAKVLGKRELVDLVVAASGIKKRAAKPVIEAMLKELGDALSRGETLNLQPFGKGIVKNRKDLENAEVVELRLRRSKLALKAAETPATDPLAEAAE